MLINNDSYEKVSLLAYALYKYRVDMTAMIALAVWQFGHISVAMVRLRLLLLVLIPTLFFVSSSMALMGHYVEVT